MSLQKGFVLAAALVLALTVGGGAASAQDGKMVAVQLENPHYDESLIRSGAKDIAFTRLGIAKAVGSTEGVTVDLAADTVRLAPGQYWVSGVWGEGERLGAPHTGRLYMREISAVYAEDSTGTTVEMVRDPTILSSGLRSQYSSNQWFVVVNGDGATPDDVKLGTVGRRMDFSCCGGSTISQAWQVANWVFIRRLGD